MVEKRKENSVLGLRGGTMSRGAKTSRAQRGSYRVHLVKGIDRKKKGMRKGK